MKQDETVDIQNNQTIKVKHDHKLTVTDGNRAITVSKGNDTFEVTHGQPAPKYQAWATPSLKLDMGNYSIKASLGNVTVEAMQSIELKVGQQLGEARSDGGDDQRDDAEVEGRYHDQVHRPMTTVKGDGMLTLKGGIMMLN